MTKKWMLGLLIAALALAGCGVAPVTSEMLASSAPAAVEEVAPAEEAPATEAPATEAAAEEPAAPAPDTPRVSVADQAVVDGQVTVAEAFSKGPGWLVIHADREGKPGPVLGFSPVVNGLNQNVVVALDVAGVTETLYAMLHVDVGELGKYEFPGVDGPVVVDGQIVAPSFQVEVK